MSGDQDDADRSALLDVSQVPIGDLVASNDSNLGYCIDRIVNSLDDPDGVCSAFDSFVSDDDAPPVTTS